ncbi:MAG: hypothetical protein K1X57_20360 [Gemmataceae bacterium]|nr:hypothetical protein [Gemmataceae bacterium]
MFIQTEAKPQGWRAVATFNDERPAALLYLGRSSTQVRAGYVEAYAEILDEEERETVSGIELQRWHGAPDDGRWVLQTSLRIPAGKPAKLAFAA